MYLMAKAESVELSNVGPTSMTARLNIIPGTNEIKSYHFKVNDAEDFVTSETNEYTFEVEETGDYTVEAYAKDELDKETNSCKGKISCGKYFSIW